jgi:hypothetical protein
MRHRKGHVRFYDDADNEKDMVGYTRNDETTFVIVKWEEGLRFVCYGECTIGQVKLQDSTTQPAPA